MDKLKAIYILIIALILVAGIAAFFLVMVVKPKQKEIGDLNQKIETENLEFAKKASTEKALQVALADKAKAEKQWQDIMSRQMSNLSLEDKNTAIFALWKEFHTYEPELTRAMNADPNVQLKGTLNFMSAWPGWVPVDQSVLRREFPQSFPMHFSSFPKLLEWLQNLNKLPRVIQLSEGITITPTPISGTYAGIDAPFSGVVYIDYPMPKSLALAAAAAAAAGGTGYGPGMGGGMRGGGRGGGMRGGGMRGGGRGGGMRGGGRGGGGLAYR
jgi:cell division protein FtsL